MTSITKQCEKNVARILPATKATGTIEHYQDGAATFTHMYNTLPHLLSKTMAENLSPAVAFYSVLHLANENRLRLLQIDGKSDFLIRKLTEVQTTTAGSKKKSIVT